MLVGRSDLDAALARVRAGVADPRHGIHGPGSAAWRLQRESVVFLGGGRAALLQLAHPFVAYGVDQHSRTRTDVVGRFRRTFMNVFAMTFGELDEALVAARRVHTIHTRVTGTIPEAVGPFVAGTPYHANDADALLWVYATLIDTVVTTTERVRGRLEPALKEAYYRDSWAFARLFGIPDALIPPDWAAFERYVDGMLASPVLTVAPPAREMARFLFGRGPGQRPTRLAGLAEALSAAMLPARLRDAFELPWGWRERALAGTVLGAARPGHRVVPRGLRYLPAYVAARRRLAGVEPWAVSAWLEQRLFRIAGQVAR
jgi:uncharacterized protein (DUF2236 family)